MHTRIMKEGTCAHPFPWCAVQHLEADRASELWEGNTRLAGGLRSASSDYSDPIPVPRWQVA